MFCRTLFWIFVFITQVCTGQVGSNSIYFDHLSINDGLSHNTVYSVLQDQNGYIWIGTQNGLNKYDGYSFEVYQSYDLENNKEGFVGKHVSALFEDKKGNLWVGTNNHGINFKAKSSDIFVNLQSDSTLVSIKGFEISSFFEDKKDNIWITTVGAGVIKYNPKTKVYQVFNNNNSSLSSDVTFDIVEDKYGTLWVAAAGVGLNYLTNNNQFKTFNGVLSTNSNMSGFRKKMLLDDEYLWIGTQGTGLYKMNLKDKSIIHFVNGNGNGFMNSNVVMDLFKTKDGRLYIATDGNGLNIYDTTTKEMSIYEYHNNEEDGLNTNALHCLYGDRTGNIWIGTFNGGLNIYKPNKTWFNLITPYSSSISNFPHQSILSILQDRNGTILVGTDGGGLNFLNKNNDNFEASIFIQDPSNPNSIAGNVVKSLFEDSQGNIWVGLFAGGLNLFNPTTKSFQHFMEWRPNVWSITERKNGDLLVATLGDGIYIVDAETKEIRRFNPQMNVLNSSIDHNIMTVFVDQSDRIWIGSLDKGLDIIDESNNTFKHLKHNPLDSFSISDNEIRTIYQDKSGEIWIGTEGRGLNRWLGDGRFERIDKKDGLIANSIMGITEDNNGLIWISTFKGISRLDKKTKEIKNFNFRTSQNTNQFNQNSILSDQDGKIYFGGINGLHSIQPERVIENNLQTELLFTDLKIYGKSVPVGKLQDGRTILEKPIENSSDIWLSYLDKSFTVFFNAIDYTNPLENEFAFKMEGFNEDWEYTSAGKPSSTYTNLNAGTYVFKIKHKENIAAINIHVKSPFWETIWFRIFAVLVFLGLIFSGMYFWIKKREAAANHKILQLKNEKLATEMTAKNSKLMFSSVQMAHKNEILTEIKEKLIEFAKNPKSNYRPLIRKVDYELKNEDYWKEFNLYFTEVDKKFVDRIINKHPDLTKNDLRICSLLRMNLITKEISLLLNISVRAVEQSRYRLKKRLGLSKLDDLSKYISSFNHEN